MADGAVRDALVAAAADFDGEIRRSAARALAKLTADKANVQLMLADGELRLTLVAAAGDESTETRRAAVAALADLAADATTNGQLTWADAALHGALHERGADAVDAETWWWAADAMAELLAGDAGSTPLWQDMAVRGALLSGAGGHSEEVRQAADRALRSLEQLSASDMASAAARAGHFKRMLAEFMGEASGSIATPARTAPAPASEPELEPYRYGSIEL